LTTKSPVGHIRFFGGSTTWGSGVDDQNTIPAHFNALHPNYQVHNHGEAGFVSRQELARLVNLVNQNAPMDLVGFYDGCNDAHHMCRADLSLNGHREESKIRNKLKPRSQVVDSLSDPFGITSIGSRLSSRIRSHLLSAKQIIAMHRTLQKLL
jgi:hypothetical protein